MFMYFGEDGDCKKKKVCRLEEEVKKKKKKEKLQKYTADKKAKRWPVFF